MANQKIKLILETAFPQEIVEHILRTYTEVESSFRLEKWKSSELDSGHFVEAVRRLIDYVLNGSYTPFAVSICAFNQGVLNRYESSTGLEEYRILIPRVLYSMYCIRNKRGVGHISSISPNKLDATYILHSAKWVLAELVRLSGSSSPDDAKQITDEILERQVDLIWDDGESFMILDKKLKATDRILLCLYKKDRISVEELRTRVDYKNKSNFRKLISDLRRDKFIDLITEDICKLSPLGVISAERIVSKIQPQYDKVY